MINLIVFVFVFFVSDSPHSTPWGQWHFTKAPLHLRARPIAPSGCFRVFVGSFTALSPVSYLLNEGVRTGDRQTCPPQTVLILIVSSSLMESTYLLNILWMGCVFSRLQAIAPSVLSSVSFPLLCLPNSLRISLLLLLSVRFREECNRFVSAYLAFCYYMVSC